MWGDIIIIAAVLLLTIYGFVTLARFEKRMLASKSSRTSEDMHDSHADPARNQRRPA
jgi:hypothetical protein